MSNKMSLTINNFGPINEADLKIGKINVIVGKNSTGKSTSSKFLFSLLTASSREGMNFANKNLKDYFVNFLNLWKNKLFAEKNILYNVDDMLINPLENNPLNDDLFNRTYNQTYELFKDIEFNDKDTFLKDLEEINQLILLNSNRYIRYINVLNSLIRSEYGSSLQNYANSKITFFGQNNGESFEQEITFDNDLSKGKITDNFLAYFNYENIIYIDSPSIFEIQNMYNAPYHLKVLERKLKKISNEDVYGDEYYKDLKEFKKKIDLLIGGEFKYSSKENKFVLNIDNHTYPMESTSSGLKQLGVFQLLLENNELTKNSFLILDEPEINLHPEFQVKLAKILVLAVKELNIDLYINTHSPFFSEAIEVYSRLYDLDEDTNFYLTEKVESINKFNYRLMNNEDILEVYDNLGNPFDEIRKINLQADLKKDFKV